MIETVKKYKLAGLSCLPTSPDKSPYKIKTWIKTDISIDAFNGCYGIGIKCGNESGGLECLDFDNHQNTAKENLTKFIDEINGLYEKYKFPIESTVSGGFHLLYCCEKFDGNKKLAQVPIYDEKNHRWKGDTIIETRGEGGYFCCDPTPGYKFIRGDIYRIPLITPDERKEILEVCKSFNKFIEPKKTEYENNDKPGDIYNKSYNAINESISLLLSSGWTQLKTGYWQRPGKSKGISATFGQVADNVFYVFSSNAYPFEPEKAYLPFQILALLKYNGDFKECAKELSKDLGLEKPYIKEKKEISENELKDILNNCYIDLDVQIDKPPVIMFISDTEATTTIRKRVFTIGNFSCIIGKAKSRKTFLTSMFTAAMLKNSSIYYKFYGNLPDEKRQILYFDTEQGEYDAANNIKRIIRLSGLNNDLLGAFNLRQFTPIERCIIINYAFTVFKNVGLVVIDGIADLANAINDEEEATRVTTLLLKWSKNNGCHIITVLHQNKNDNFATGHLGSSVMKKAEIVISVAKEKGSAKESVVSCDYSRGMDFDDFNFEIIDGLPVITNIMQEQETIKYYNE